MTLAGKARRPFHIFCAAVFSSGLLYPVPRAVVRFSLVTALRLPPALYAAGASLFFLIGGYSLCHRLRHSTCGVWGKRSTAASRASR